MAGKKKTARKNSNYQKTYKYVTIDQLCSILHCRIEDIAEYREQKTPPDA